MLKKCFVSKGIPVKSIEIDQALESLWVLVRETSPIVIGSQSLHGKFPDVADTILYSREVDVILQNKAKLGNWLSDVVGDGTPFAVDRGYYIDHVFVSEGFPVFAKGWQDRSIKRPVIYNGQKVGEVQFLSPEDMAISKLGAGREKDFIFIAALIEKGLLEIGAIEDLIPLLDHVQIQKVTSGLNFLISKVLERSPVRVDIPKKI